jgi:hypothetical protein
MLATAKSQRHRRKERPESGMAQKGVGVEVVVALITETSSHTGRWSRHQTGGWQDLVGEQLVVG